jgi:GGDEF domain-containing protein
LAKALLGASRDVDLVARVEPDLFVVVLPETDAAGTGRLRDRIAPDLTTIDSAAHFGHATLGDAASGDAAYTGHDLLLAACRDADAPALPCRLS